MLNRLAVTAVVSVGTLLASGLCGAEPSPAAADPNHGTWRVCCEDFFSPTAKRPNRPLPIYVISRDGKFVYGLGSAPDWNTTSHPADVSALRYDAASGKLTGTIQVKLNPDPWVPEDGKPVTCSLDVEATLDSAGRRKRPPCKAPTAAGWEPTR